MSLRDTASSFKFDVSSAHETAHRRIGRGGGTGEGVARGGAAPGRVREGGTQGGLGRSPRSQRFFFCVENPQKYVKAALKM